MTTVMRFLRVVCDCTRNDCVGISLVNEECSVGKSIHKYSKWCTGTIALPCTILLATVTCNIWIPTSHLHKEIFN